MRLRIFLLLASTLFLAHTGWAEKVIWQNDFEQSDDITDGFFGPPTQGFGCQGEIVNRSCGNAGGMNIVFKGIDTQKKFSGEKALKLEINSQNGNYFYFYSNPLNKKIAIKPNLYFSGYLNKDSEIDPKLVVKVCPRFETVRQKDNKKVIFEYRHGGFSPTSGLVPQSAKNWYFFCIGLDPVVNEICKEEGYSREDTFFIGWAIMINGSLGEKNSTVYVDDIKLYEQEDPRAELGQNMALHKPYSWNITPNAFLHGYQGDPMCTDSEDNVQLTNGRLASRCWFDKETVGWWEENKPINITVDLGASMPVETVMIHLSSEKDGKRVPASLRVFTSDDQKEFHLAGEMGKRQSLVSWFRNSDSGAQDGNPQGWVILSGMKSKGRYVTFVMQSSVLYLDEICVFSGKLKPEDIKIPAEEQYLSLNAVTPFYKFRDAVIAAEIVTPLLLKMDDRKPLDLDVDLPEGLTIAAPASRITGRVSVNGANYTRHEVKQAREIYLKSTLPAGSTTSIRLEGMSSAGELSGIIQKIPVKIVSIPDTKPFKTILTNVGFAGFDFWQRWPEAVKNYKHTGLNLFTPLGSNDYYYRLWQRQDANVIKMLNDAKQAGLFIGGNYSPFCNNQINSKELSPRKAVYINNGKPDTVNCPRVYFDQYLANPENQDINSVVYGFKNGLDMMFFDSEPFWGGAICACPECEKLWNEFLVDKKVDSVSIKDAAEKKPELLQEFWNEFYIKLWKKFKTAATEASPGRDVKIGAYNCPGTSEQYHFGNGARFSEIYKSGIFDFGNPTSYHIQTPELGSAMRDMLARAPAGAPFYVWLTAGGPSLSFELTSAEFKNRVFEVLLNGGKGIIVWTVAGFDTQDYQAFSEAIRILQPHEDILINGKLINSQDFSANDKQAQISGLDCGNKTLLLVTRYDESQQGTVVISPRIQFNKASILTGGNLKNENGKLHVSFSGAENDYTQIILLEK